MDPNAILFCMKHKIALLPMCSGHCPDANLETIVKAIEQAKSQNASLLFSPENSNLLSRSLNKKRQILERFSAQEFIDKIAQAAQKAEIGVVLGSVICQLENSHKLANRSVYIDHKGVLQGYYDKIHLFDSFVEERAICESDSFVAGTRLVCVQTPLGIMGMSICYDLRFPQMFQKLVQQGATILSIPASFTRVTGEAHWHCLLRARAIENQVFVVAAAQTGEHEDGCSTYGHSVVYDPWGNLLCDTSNSRKLAVVEIDLAELQKVREKMPVESHKLAGIDF